MNSRVNSLFSKDLEKDSRFKKMTNREYLKWRLEVINGEIKPISIRATIGLAFLSLIGVYWFFPSKTKPPIKILMGILNLFAVAALVCAIVLNLSLYFLVAAAIVYGLFVLASCIHVGLRRYKEDVEYQEEFVNTYNEIMGYLDQAKQHKSVVNKINDIQEKETENIINIEENKGKKKVKMRLIAKNHRNKKTVGKNRRRFFCDKNLCYI